MFGFDDAKDNHQDVYQDGDFNNQASFTHEVAAGAVAFEAMRKYQQHEEANGVAENHTAAKDILAGFAGAEADRLVETKGEDAYDREKLRRDAQDNANNLYDQQYGNQGDQGNNY